MKNILVLPDSHAHPDFHNKRFGYFGQLVCDLKPDIVFNLGDLGDMPSLCMYDKGKSNFESRRYKNDINSIIDAQEKMFAPIKAAKKKKPKFIWLEGNHEQRIKRAISLDAVKLEGIISTSDLCHREFGWEYHPYEGATPAIVTEEGVAFAHYFTSGVMGRPVGGMNIAHNLIQKQYMSCVQGHVHILDYTVRTNARGKHIMGLVAGVFQDYYSDYAGAANDLWWKGAVYLRNVEDGMFDPEFISFRQIEEAYK